MAVEWVELGRLGAPYGIKGWLHIESHTDPKQALLTYRDWTLKFASGERSPRRLAEGRIHGEGLVARIEGIADRNAAALLTGARIEVQRARLPAPKKNEYYQTDLVGMKVGNLEGVFLRHGQPLRRLRGRVTDGDRRRGQRSTGCRRGRST